jgi:hypothetical protein
MKPDDITLEIRGGGKTVMRILKGAHVTPNKLKTVVTRMFNELTAMDDVVPAPVLEPIPEPAPAVEQDPVPAPPQLPEPARPEIPPGKIEQ